MTEITDLPERATVKIIPLVSLHLTALSSPTTTSDTECSTADTEILSTVGASPSLRQQWPDLFDIPNFSVDVEYRLRQADLAFMKDETPRDMKHDILEKLAETMYCFKANTPASLSLDHTDGMAGKTALNLRWPIIAQSFEKLDVRM